MRATNEAAAGIALPDALERRLYDFRGLVWRIKIAEAIAGAVCGVAIAYLILFAADRVMETPAALRFATFAAAVAACAALPVALHRWIWRHRGLDQVARLIARRFPSLGDQILGIIEIVRSAAAGEAVQSRALCEAAIAQVAGRAESCDFAQAVPRPFPSRRRSPSPRSLPRRPPTPGRGSSRRGGPSTGSRSRAWRRCPARWSCRTARRRRSR